MTGLLSHISIVTELSVFMFVFCWYLATAGDRKHKFEIKPLCTSNTSYGTELISHNDVEDIMACSLLCMNDIQCESCLYTDTSLTCSLNSLFVRERPTCQQNVKYAQKRPFQCVTSGDYRVCGLDLYSVPGEITGYIEVNVTGVWGTVCDDYWEEEESGHENAAVFCNSMGYSNGTPVYPLRVHPIVYYGPIVMDTVKCVGSENNLHDCPHDTWTNCLHDEDTVVRCY